MTRSLDVVEAGLGPTVRAVLSSELPATVPVRVVLVPWGEVESAGGRFVLDAESARAVVQAFEAQGNDLPIDYEHQTLGGRYASPSGQAPAAGWIKRLEAVEGEGLVATVEWTAPAAEHLAAREYRYLSPVVLVRRTDRRVTGLHSAALTNKPAIVRMRPIVNSDRLCQGSSEGPVYSGDRGTDRAIGLRDGHTEAEDRLMQTTWDTLRGRLGLDESADEAQILLEASERIEDLSGKLARRGAEEAVALAMKAGKLTTAQKDWAVALALRDPELFRGWLEHAPVVVAHGRIDEACGESRPAPGVETARQEYRDSELLQSLTSEEAYVSDAARVQGGVS